MKPTSKKTYRIVKAILERKTFTQYAISKEEGITFSLVNRVVNWLRSISYVAKRTGEYEVVAPAAIFNLFPLYRKMTPYARFDVDVTEKEVRDMLKGKGVFCLTTALSYYDDYFRDSTFHVYLEDAETIEKLRAMPKGYMHIEAYHPDLGEDFVKKNGQRVTDKVRTIIDLFCADKAYAAERLIKREWGR